MTGESVLRTAHNNKDALERCIPLEISEVRRKMPNLRNPSRKNNTKGNQKPSSKQLILQCGNRRQNTVQQPVYAEKAVKPLSSQHMQKIQTSQKVVIYELLPTLHSVKPDTN